jgi:hypothetical protein
MDSFRKGEWVDVFLRKPFGWIEGRIVGVEQFSYRVRLESLYNDREMVTIPFWATVAHNDMAIASHRTHCREDWRLNLENYTYFECVEKGIWTSCKKLIQTEDQVLVLTASDCHWFPIQSPHLRCIWEFRDMS